jgi:hypothetical protein
MSHHHQQPELLPPAQGLRIKTFVIMPTHLHLILFDADFDNDRLRNTVRDMRQFTGWQLADYSEKHLPSHLCPGHARDSPH